MSVTTIRLGHSSTNKQALSRAHDTANASPFVGEYQLSHSLMKHDPAYTNFHPYGQHRGLFVGSQEQSF